MLHSFRSTIRGTALALTCSAVACFGSALQAEQLTGGDEAKPSPWGPSPKLYMSSSLYETMEQKIGEIEGLAPTWVGTKEREVGIHSSTEWEKMKAIPGLFELCGKPCTEDDMFYAMITKISRDSTGSYRKDVFINLSAIFSRDVEAKTVTYTAAQMDCLMTLIEREILFSIPESPTSQNVSKPR